MLCRDKALQEPHSAVSLADFSYALNMLHTRLLFVIRLLFRVEHNTARAAAYIPVGHRFVFVATTHLFPPTPAVINSVAHILHHIPNHNSSVSPACIRYNANPLMP
jgi:hypothetical protein